MKTKRSRLKKGYVTAVTDVGLHTTFVQKLSLTYSVVGIAISLVLMFSNILRAQQDSCPDIPFTAQVSGSTSEVYTAKSFTIDPYPFCYDTINCPANYQGKIFTGRTWHNPGSDGPCGSNHSSTPRNTSQHYCVYESEDLRETGTFVSNTINGVVRPDGPIIVLGPALQNPEPAHNCNSMEGPPLSWCVEKSKFFDANLIVTSSQPEVKVYFNNLLNTTDDPFASVLAEAKEDSCPTPPIHHVTVNATSFSIGHSVLLRLTVDPMASEVLPKTVDLYVVIQTPEDQQYLKPDRTLTSTPTPFATEWSPTPIADYPLYLHEISGGEKPGRYNVLSAFVAPGTFDRLGDLATTTFVILP